MLKFLQNKRTLIKCLTAILFVGTVLNAQTTKNCEYRTFNIKLNETVTVNEIITQLSDICNFSLVVKDPQAKLILDTTLQGINIKDMSLFEVFDLVVKENNLNYKYEKNILKVSALETKTFKLDYITSVREGTATLSGSVEVEPVAEGTAAAQTNRSHNEIKTKEKFDFWATLDAELKAILNNGSESYITKDPIINTNTGLITISGTKSQLNRVEKYLNELKKRLHKQVLIDVSIIAVELKNDYTTGIDWSKFQLSIAGSNSAGEYSSWDDAANKLSFIKNINIINNMSFSMEGLMNFIQEKGKSKIISSPKVMTLNNQQSLITVGDNINYRVLEETETDSDTGEFKITYTPYSVFIGILLNILPEVSDDNKIMLRINPSLSSFKYSEDNAKTTEIREIAPDTLEKKLSTVVQVNSGDTIIMGGLIGQTKGKDKTSVPILSNIPFLGEAFKSTTDSLSTTELIFVVTPHVINAEKYEYKTSLKDLGFTESMYE